MSDNIRNKRVRIKSEFPVPTALWGNVSAYSWGWATYVMSARQRAGKFDGMRWDTVYANHREGYGTDE